MYVLWMCCYSYLMAPTHWMYVRVVDVLLFLPDGSHTLDVCACCGCAAILT
ncbi:hypothetical protein DPMN_021274 [Dreissena polymorpha]|uniref:Uncharacterized protein n=1 Tax=Dreissena polymorpha TaxID=45954 RepID=A0A9D4SAY5_DREPO|nr:hypothetical protein DPMN_021274 [Dreissena polymorpha]